jgi:hypothetical protein
VKLGLCAAWLAAGCSVYDASLRDACDDGASAGCPDPKTSSGPTTSGTFTRSTTNGAGGVSVDAGNADVPLGAGGASSSTSGSTSGAGGTQGSGGAGGSAGGGGQSSAGGAGSTGRNIADASTADAFESSVPCPGAGTALSFDRMKSQNVVIPGALFPSGSAPRTIEMWVMNPYPTSNWAPNHSLWEIGGGDALATFAMDFDTFNTRGMELFVNPVANSYFFDTGMPQNSWFHVAGTYDGTETHAFINGVEIGSGFTPNGPLNTPSNQPLYVASNPTGGDYFTGSIDEVRVWNVARTAVEIARDMSYRLAGNEPGLAGLYRFDEGSGAIAHDATGHGLDGKIANGATFVASGATLRCR